MATTDEETIRNYLQALTEWEIGLAKVSATCATRDERGRARAQFMVDHEEQYRELMNLFTEHTIYDHLMHARRVEAHEVHAGIHSAAELAGATMPTTTGEEVLRK